MISGWICDELEQHAAELKVALPISDATPVYSQD